MKNNILEPKKDCIKKAMEIIGSKWTALILRDLYLSPKGFCELQESVGGVNPRTLSLRLQNLESNGIITSKHYRQVPPKSEYALTKKGEDLIPIIKEMSDWGAKYRASVI